jgi:hypothetical protein
VHVHPAGGAPQQRLWRLRWVRRSACQTVKRACQCMSDQRGRAVPACQAVKHVCPYARQQQRGVGGAPSPAPHQLVPGGGKGQVGLHLRKERGRLFEQQLIGRSQPPNWQLYRQAPRRCRGRTAAGVTPVLPGAASALRATIEKVACAVHGMRGTGCATVAKQCHHTRAAAAEESGGQVIGGVLDTKAVNTACMHIDISMRISGAVRRCIRLTQSRAGAFATSGPRARL